MSDFKPVNQTITPMSADPGEEFPFLHTITVVDRVVSVDKPELVQNNIKTETVTLNLDSEWDGLSCIINIGNGDTPTSLIWSGQPVTIPAELMTDTGTLNVSVVGYGDDGALRAVTKKADAMFTVVASGYVEGDEPVPDPTTILGQLTEAADRANQAAQNADDSTIDKVNVTMLPTGSDPSGSVSDKTLSLSIPNGPQGPQGPKGDPGDLTTVAHDGTLTGDGTSGNVLRQAAGSCLNNGEVSSFNDLTKVGFYAVYYTSTDTPVGDHRGTVFVSQPDRSAVVGQLFFSTFDSSTARPRLFARLTGDRYTQPIQWSDWVEFAKTDDLSNYVPLSIYQALEARVQALEARVQALEAKLAN